MHHVRIALHKHQLAHFHRAVFADPAYVVASQVHQHHMFGALLLIAAKLLLQPLIFRFVAPACASAGNRPITERATLHSNQHLGRRTQNGHVAHP